MPVPIFLGSGAGHLYDVGGVVTSSPWTVNVFFDIPASTPTDPVVIMVLGTIGPYWNASSSAVPPFATFTVTDDAANTYTPLFQTVPAADVYNMGIGVTSALPIIIPFRAGPSEGGSVDYCFTCIPSAQLFSGDHMTLTFTQSMGALTTTWLSYTILAFQDADPAVNTRLGGATLDPTNTSTGAGTSTALGLRRFNEFMGVDSMGVAIAWSDDAKISGGVPVGTQVDGTTQQMIDTTGLWSQVSSQGDDFQATDCWGGLAESVFIVAGSDVDLTTPAITFENDTIGPADADIYSGFTLISVAYSHPTPVNHPVFNHRFRAAD